MPKFQFKYSTVNGATPSSLSQGELAINITNQKMWVGNNIGGSTQIFASMAAQESNNVSITGGSLSLSNVGTSTPSTATISSNFTVGGATISAIRETSGSSTTDVMAASGAKSLVEGLGGKLKNIFTFTSSGTYYKSGDDVQVLHIIVVGGGGGARAYSENGGGGGFAERRLDVSSWAAQTSVSVTVGGGGGGGSYFGFSGDGGTTSFGSYVSAGGGYGANRNSSHNGGHGGIGYGGDVNTYGGMGCSHNNMDQYSSSNASGGIGGGTYYGGSMHGDRPNWSTPTQGAPGTGGVSISPNHNGQGGRSGLTGICVVYEYR